MRLITKLKNRSIEWLPLLSKIICIISDFPKYTLYLLLQPLFLLRVLSLRSCTPSISKNFVLIWIYHAIKYHKKMSLFLQFSLPEYFYPFFLNYLVTTSSRSSSNVIFIPPPKTLFFWLLVNTSLWCRHNVKITVHQLFDIEFHSLLLC